MNCRTCKDLPKCVGKTDAWEERVAICVADGMPEDKSEEIACKEMMQEFKRIQEEEARDD